MKKKTGEKERAKKIEIKDKYKKVNFKETDIIHIDLLIKEKLMKKKEKIQKYLLKLQELKKNSNEYEIIRQRKKILDLESGSNYTYYLLKTHDIIDEYKKIINSAKRIFVITKENQEKIKEIELKKKDLILKYIIIASQYILIENYSPEKRKIKCDVCQSESFDIESNSIFTCRDCGFIKEIPEIYPSFKDTDRMTLTDKYEYTCLKHFIEATDKTEGVPNPKITEKVFEILRQEMKDHSLTKNTLTKDNLYTFLVRNEMNDFYNDINYIYFYLTQNPPHDLSQYRQKAIEMFLQQEEEYPKVKNPNRINSLNVYFKVLKIYNLCGYKFNIDDFYILRTIDKLEEHEETWNNLVAILKKKYPGSNWCNSP